MIEPAGRPDQDAGRVPDSDAGWVAAQLVESLMPGASANEQLDILLRLPVDSPLYLNLRRSLKPFSADALERRLEALIQVGEAEPIKRLLFFASGSTPALSDRTRKAIVEYLFSKGTLEAALAAEIAASTADLAIYDHALERLETSTKAPDDSEDAFNVGRLIALAIIARDRQDFAGRIPRRFLGFAAGAGKVLETFSTNCGWRRSSRSSVCATFPRRSKKRPNYRALIRASAYLQLTRRNPENG